jgi:hypothetical protein
MKVVSIKVRTIVREVIIYFVLFMAAFFTNVYAIRLHDAPWSELWSQFHIVLALSVVYLVLFTLLRGIVYLLIYLPVKTWVWPRFSGPGKGAADAG